MNVGELIEELKKLPLDAPVRVWNHDQGAGWFTRPMEDVAENDNNNSVVIF